MSAALRYPLPSSTASFRKRIDVSRLRAVQPWQRSRALHCVAVQTSKKSAQTRAMAMISRSGAAGRWQIPAAEWTRSLLARIGRSAALAAACATFLLGAPQPLAADTVVRVPAAADEKIFTAQQTLLEAWKIVAEAYEDPSFNGRNWEQDLAEGLINAAFAPNAQEAYNEIPRMLEGLGDPYTRWIPASDFNNFRIGTDGELQGVGLMIAQDSASRRLMVLASLEGSPAARAGIQPGDEVVAIDGTETAGFSNDRAASLLRGKSGTSVTLRFVRRSPQVPGVPGRPESPPQVQSLKVNLKRERLAVSPVFSTAFRHEGPNGRSTTGYIRLINFSMHAADDVTKAIKGLKAQGASSLILDLRQNPGGLVRSGVDIARLFLDAPAPIFNVAGRGGGATSPSSHGGADGGAQQLAPTKIMQKVVIDSSVALTKQPLAVLLDGQSASASEILAGALKDNGHRAVLIGDEATYGKGKIQNVFELVDGSALFVTVARYATPNLTDIDKVGITPDLTCHALDLSTDSQPNLPAPSLREGLAMQLESTASLQSDACVHTAEAYLDNLVASKPSHEHGFLARWK